VKLGNWGFCGEDVSLRLGWEAPITWDFGIEKLNTKKSRDNHSGYLCYPHENTHDRDICKWCANSKLCSISIF